MTQRELRVLGALIWSERGSSSLVLALRRVARNALGGDDTLAAKVLAELDLKGCVATDTMGWHSGWLTSKGRALARSDGAA